LDAVEHTAEVQADDALPFVPGPLMDLGQVAPARIVEHGAEPAERCCSVVDRGPERVVVGDVNGVRQPVDLLRDPVGPLAVPSATRGAPSPFHPPPATRAPSSRMRRRGPRPTREPPPVTTAR